MFQSGSRLGGSLLGLLHASYQGWNLAASRDSIGQPGKLAVVIGDLDGQRLPCRLVTGRGLDAGEQSVGNDGLRSALWTEAVSIRALIRSGACR